MSVLDGLGTFPASDEIILGPLKSPGRARIVPSGGASPRTWEIRKGYGISGATVVYGGDGLARFGVEIALWLPLQFLEWELFAKALLDKPMDVRGGIPLPPKSLGFYHPVLAASPYRITQVVVEDVTPWEQDDEALWTCRIDFLEFKRPLPALGKPLAAIPAGAKETPTAQDAFDAELQAKFATLQGLAGGGL